MKPTDPGDADEERPRDREHGWLDAHALMLEAQRRADPEVAQEEEAHAS